ncbi:polyadenylate-binding protein, cytoplasmic and nuclear-like [Arachis ipaensis]|uniref:polyadenylate-binding protein, cytoplasmic and nuclear-like n=1 Tax=Arachis ipaensis TaxID=130454 RepID=UPI0007AF8931|nr:polyadenylate-binding protein, cytoplasmic and nuclear-like [Arachis ipaensis]XP_025628067.1 polyadenylate-binding protein, cytoplasmic and nuclear-like [Arachis hypogaea]
MKEGWENNGRGRFRQLHYQCKDPRVWNRKEYVRLEQESFTVFVDRLPGDISKQELFQMFSWTGRINDIYLSRKTRQGVVYFFAFIRYTTKGGALKAIAEMNGICVRGKEIFVGEAKYRRDDLSKGKVAVEIEEARRSKVVVMTDRDKPQEHNEDHMAERRRAVTRVHDHGLLNQHKDELDNAKIPNETGVSMAKEIQVSVANPNLD